MKVNLIIIAKVTLLMSVQIIKHDYDYYIVALVLRG